MRFYGSFLAVMWLAASLGSASAKACGPEALGTGRTIAVGAAGGLEIGLKSYPRTLALRPREVVLTFDDGPLPGQTNQVLAALARECVRATFFLIGRNAEANPSLVRRIAAAGHTVANHTYAHTWTLRRLPEAGARAEIERGFHAIDAALGRPAARFFRYPGFGDRADTNAWLARQGIAVFGADVWASDWTGMSAQAQLSLILSRLERSGGGIVLFHDTRPQTAAMLPAFLRALKARGFSVVHVVEGRGRPALREAGPGWRSETEAILRRTGHGAGR